MIQRRPLALVTGASRGIGAGIALEMAARGFDIALADIDPQGAATVCEQVFARGVRGRVFALDLGAVARHAATLDEIIDWAGPVACLVNNAGIPVLRRGDLLDIAQESYDRVLDVNLRGTFFLTQAVARHMLAAECVHPRSIVTVSSVSADMASVDRGEYCVSKAGVSMLTKLFALRLAPHGIGVFEVRPGVIRTPMTEAVAPVYEQRIAGGLVPMQRWGYPLDVAHAVCALACGEMSFSTGSVLNVDGGLSLPRL